GVVGVGRVLGEEAPIVSGSYVSHARTYDASQAATVSLVSGTTPSSLGLWRDEALQVAFVSGEQLIHIDDVVGVDVRLAPDRPRMQLELEFEHRSAVLGVHFCDSLFKCLVIGSISLL